MVSLMMENAGQLDARMVIPSGCDRLLLADKLAIGVLWHQCCLLRDVKSQPVPMEESPDLSQEDDEKLQQRWWDRHSFTLPASKLLESKKMNKLLKAVRQSAVRLPPMRLQELRTLACFTDTKEAYLKMPEQGACRVVKAIEDAVHDNFDLWLRVAALFDTLAYVSTENPSFCDLSHVEHALDRIATFVNRRYGTGASAAPAPTSFFVRAFDEMWNMALQKVNICALSFNQFLREGLWEKLWENYLPYAKQDREVVANSQNPYTGASSSDADRIRQLERDLQKERHSNEQRRAHIDNIKSKKGGAPNAKRQANWNNKNDDRRDGGSSSFPRGGKGAKGKGKNSKHRRV